jgi:hypothetical protein
MNEDRRWMYSGRKSKNDITPEWVDKTSDFLEKHLLGILVLLV